MPRVAAMFGRHVPAPPISRMKPILPLFLLVSALAAGSALALDVTVTVTGIRNAKGKIAALAFSNKDGFPDQPAKALAQAVVDAKQGTVTLTLKNLPPGKLAITVLHDQDANGKLNRSIIGIPLEGVGMSGDTAGKLPPTFADALEEFKTSRKITVPLKYW
jgi:uncharacterized protein (DUF2141 family)